LKFTVFIKFHSEKTVCFLRKIISTKIRIQSHLTVLQIEERMSIPGLTLFRYKQIKVIVYKLKHSCVILGSGATPAHLAALGAHLQSLSCLIKHGADIEAQTASGDLPLDFAKRSGNPNSFLKAGTYSFLESQRCIKFTLKLRCHQLAFMSLPLMSRI